VYRGHEWSRNTLSGSRHTTTAAAETSMHFRTNQAHTTDASTTQNPSSSLSDTLGTKHERDYDAGSMVHSQVLSAFEAAPNAELEIKGEKRKDNSMV
jgi:hypothetical protein